MRITLKLVGGLVHTVGFSQRELEVPPGTTVAEILASNGVQPGRPMIVARNGHGVPVEQVVQDGDRILVSPIFSGG